MADASTALDPSAAPLQVVKLFGSVVAPVTLLTALMYYFGVLHAYYFFASFGVDYTVFDLGTQDYLARSADGLFVPLTGAAVVVLLVVWGHRLLPRRLRADHRHTAVRALVAVAAALGAAAICVATVGVFAPGVLEQYLTLPGLALTFGVLLLLSASRGARALSQQAGREQAPVQGAVAITEWAAALLLVSVGLFWAAGDWSSAVGTRRGSQVAESLTAWPDAIVYADKSLNLAVPGVRTTQCTDPDAAHTVRYDGLKLIVHAGGQYLFLPETWRATDGTAILLPESDSLRLEFTSPGVAGSQAC